MNYAELTLTIKGYCENTFPETISTFTTAEQIATFVRNAEEITSIDLKEHKKL
jgi:hypothetical protein